MFKNALLKLNKGIKDIKSQSNANIIKDNFISEKLNESSDSKEFESIDIENKSIKSENIYNRQKTNSDSEENFIITEYNEYSVFNSLEENKLKQNNDDKQIYNYLIRNYKTRKNKEEFINFFYPDGFKEIPYINAIDFYLIGVFEDLAYYPIWMSDDLLIDIVKELKLKYEIYYWRRIKGDGNCYYRSILITYIEILIMLSIKEQNPKLFFCFIKEIFFTKFPFKLNEYKVKLILVLLLIYEQVKKKNSLAYDILYRTIHKSKFIEKILIYWFKLKLSQFLKQNINLEIDGLKLLQVIPDINNYDANNNIEIDNKELNEYIDNKILKMDEYVEGYPIYITPFVLKCKINIYTINKSIDSKKKNSINLNINKEKIELSNETMFIPVIDYLPYLNNQEINLLFKSPHYDSLSTREFVNNLVDIYLNPYIILIEGILTKNEYEQYKTSIVENWNTKNFSSKKIKDSINSQKKENKNLEEESALKLYENLSEIKDTCFSNRSYYSSNSSSSMQIKYIDSSTKCLICNQYMSHKLPCGCYLCIQCSKNKIKIMKANNEIKLPISLCSCGYILNDKDQKLLLS